MTCIRAIRRILVPVLLMLGLTLTLAGPALAHDVLVSSDPADGATVTRVVHQISLTFDEPVQNYQPVITVTGPDGRQYQTGPATVASTRVSVSVALGPAGMYAAAYRIISADGHPVTGEVHFTLDAAVAGTATGIAPSAGAAPAAGNPATSDPPPSSGLASWVWIAIGVAALLGVSAVVMMMRKPRIDD